MKGARSNGKWFRLTANPPTQRTPFLAPPTLGLRANASTWGHVVEKRRWGGWTVETEFYRIKKTQIEKFKQEKREQF